MTEHDQAGDRDRDRDRRAERAREIGLFRYALVRQAADPALTGRQLGCWPET